MHATVLFQAKANYIADGLILRWVSVLNILSPHFERSVIQKLGKPLARSGTGLSHLHWHHRTFRGSRTHPAWDYAYSALADAAGSDRAGDCYGRLGDLSSEAQGNEEYAKQRYCSAHCAFRGLDMHVRSLRLPVSSLYPKYQVARE